MNRYDSYKDSGIEWIGEIPENWQIIKFRFATDLITCGHAATPEYVEEGGVMFLSAQNIKNEKLNFQKYRCIKEELHNSLTKNHKVEKGDLLQVRVGGADTIGQTAIVDIEEDFSIYVSVAQIRVNKKAFNGYIKNLCNSKEFKKYCGVIMKTGAGVANLNISDMAIMKIPLPSFLEQQIIANYLDQKNTEIDSLIAKKERLIELLEEEKTAVINQAVTKGLDPNVPMKDSGVEWLGEIPEHWGFSRLKFYSKNKTGTTPSKLNKDYWENGTIPWMSSGEVNQKKITEISKRVTEIAFEETSLELFPPGSIMIAMNGQGKTKGTVGILETATTFNQSLTAFEFSNSINSTFIFYYLDSKYQKLRGLVGEDREGLSSAILKNIYFPIPPIAEQMKIVRFLEDALSDIEKLKHKNRKQIKFLKEYKTALISEVVTGKVDVRDEVLVS